MIKIKLTQSIAADRQSVMKILLEHEQLNRFFDGRFSQTKSQTTGEFAGGVGAIRQVTLHGQTFFEQIITANEQHICYRIIGPGPVTEHQGDIMLFEDGQHTKLKYAICCKAPWWQPSSLVKAIIKRDIAIGLQRLANYYDEHSEE